ncbi:MAG: GGDEF domain-containing protein, partial [Halothiobacillaceae bacterium]
RVRDSDILGRIGGEEFALCMPCTDRDGACSLLENLQAQLREGPPRVTVQGSKPRAEPVTFSAGITALNPDDRKTVDLFIRADAQLYRAKHGGRNRICAECNAGRAD